MTQQHTFLKVWCNRRKLDYVAVLLSPNYDMLEKAAILEFNVINNLLSLSKARKEFVQSYPESNTRTSYRSVLYLISNKKSDELTNLIF